MKTKLGEYRNLLGKTQEEMARQWGIKHSYYKMIECGARNPSLQRMKEFKKAFPSANIEQIFLS